MRKGVPDLGDVHFRGRHPLFVMEGRSGWLRSRRRGHVYLQWRRSFGREWGVQSETHVVVVDIPV